MPQSTHRRNGAAGRNTLRRGKPFRTPARRFFIFCEGENTECQYFNDLRAHLRNPRVVIKVSNQTGSPSTLVKKAQTEKSKNRGDSYHAIDEYWCVWDVEHADIPTARQEAASSGIHIVESNPCFELWALLHFQNQTAPLNSKETRRQLEKHIGDYANKILPFSKLEPGYAEACKRAAQLCQRVETGNDLPNPYTDVYKLTEAIRGPAS